MSSVRLRARPLARRGALLRAVATVLLAGVPPVLVTGPRAFAQQAVVLDELSVQGSGPPGDPRLPGQRFTHTTEAGSNLPLTVKETPATVDALTQERIREEGLRSLIEAYQAVPGVVAGNLPGEPGTVTMRGFSSGAVGYTLDGVRAIDPLIASRNYDTYSFERIEVLKGPASVVSGSGALAGTINLVTRKPVFGLDRGDAFASYGGFKTVRAGASFNAAPAPTVATSGSLLLGRSGGYVDDTASQAIQLTSAVAVQATDRLKVTAGFDVFRDAFATPYQGAPLLPRSIARDPSRVVSAGDLVLDRSIRNRNYNVLDGRMDSTAVLARVGLEYALTDRWVLRNDVAAYHADRYWGNSETFTFNRASGLLDRSTTLITHDHTAWTNRTSLTGDDDLFGLRNRITAGFDYAGTDFLSHRRFGTTTAVDPFAPARGVFPDPDLAPSRMDFRSRVGNAGLFAEDALTLAPGWTLVGGIRHDWIALDRTITNLAAGTVTPFGRDFSATSWRIGTVYDLLPDVSLFGQCTSAVAPITTLLLSNVKSATFDLSEGHSIEGGVKGNLLDGRAVVTVSAYRIDQDRILTTDPTNPALTVQGGSRRAQGVEVDLGWAVTERWAVNANAAFLKAEYTKLFENGISRIGNRPSNTPEQTFNLWTTYRLASLPLTFGLGVRQVGDFYTDNANTIRVNGRALLDASVSYDVPWGGTLVVRARNLTNAFYADWSGYNTKQVYVGPPRSFDLTYSVRF